MKPTPTKTSDMPALVAPKVSKSCCAWLPSLLHSACRPPTRNAPARALLPRQRRAPSAACAVAPASAYAASAAFGTLRRLGVFLLAVRGRSRPLLPRFCVALGLPVGSRLCRFARFCSAASPALPPGARARPAPRLRARFARAFLVVTAWRSSLPARRRGRGVDGPRSPERRRQRRDAAPAAVGAGAGCAWVLRDGSGPAARRRVRRMASAANAGGGIGQLVGSGSGEELLGAARQVRRHAARIVPQRSPA